MFAKQQMALTLVADQVAHRRRQQRIHYIKEIAGHDFDASTLQQLMTEVIKKERSAQLGFGALFRSNRFNPTVASRQLSALMESVTKADVEAVKANLEELRQTVGSTVLMTQVVHGEPSMRADIYVRDALEGYQHAYRRHSAAAIAADADKAKPMLRR